MADVKSVEQVRAELLVMLSTAMDEWQTVNAMFGETVTAFEPKFKINFPNDEFSELQFDSNPVTQSLSAFSLKQSFEYSGVLDVPLHAKNIKIESFFEIFEVYQDIKNMIEKSDVYREQDALQFLNSVRPVICDLQALLVPLHDALGELDSDGITESVKELEKACQMLQERARHIAPNASLCLSSTSCFQIKPLKMQLDHRETFTVEKFQKWFNKSLSQKLTITEHESGHWEFDISGLSMLIPKFGTKFSVSASNYSSHYPVLASSRFLPIHHDNHDVFSLCLSITKSSSAVTSLSHL